MVWYAVLVIRLKQPADHIGIVSICPDSCLRNIPGEVVFGPEHMWLSRACVSWRCAAFSGGRFGFKKRRYSLTPTRRANYGFIASLWTACPRLKWMSSQAVYKDDAVLSQYKHFPNQPASLLDCLNCLRIDSGTFTSWKLRETDPFHLWHFIRSRSTLVADHCIVV